MKIRTRYAPSPTGYFHIGGARTAIYNYLFAKHMGGDFIVRIEDTDVERNVENGIESQLNNIAWLNFQPDESILNPGKYGPYIQSQKFDRYKELAHKLLDEGKAYYCFCSKEQLDHDREVAEANHQTPKYNRRCLHLSKEEIAEKLKTTTPVIRLKIDENKTYEWDDIVRGKISIPGDALTDPVILKSNGIGMYNFCVVVDDYDMDITHILRGEEHISNTPYQIAIKEALGFDSKPINYGHLSIIINESGKKLSKRDTHLKQFVEDFKVMGYLPVAVCNFLVLLGWVPKDNKEIRSVEEIIQAFDYKSLTKAPAKYDLKKLEWVGNQHMKLLSDEDYLNFVKPFVTSKNDIYLKHQDMVLLLFKNQLSYAQQLDGLIADLFADADINALKPLLEEFKEPLKTIAPIIEKKINNISDWNEENLKNMVNEIKEETKLSGKNLFMPIRMLATNKEHGPELAKTIFLFGKEKVNEKIKKITGVL